LHISFWESTIRLDFWKKSTIIEKNRLFQPKFFIRGKKNSKFWKNFEKTKSEKNQNFLQFFIIFYNSQRIDHSTAKNSVMPNKLQNNTRFNKQKKTQDGNETFLCTLLLFLFFIPRQKKSKKKLKIMEKNPQFDVKFLLQNWFCNCNTELSVHYHIKNI